jgi:cysteine desulfurase
MKRSYKDPAAATPVRPEVLEGMQPFFVQRFGNPSALYGLGAEIKEVMEGQREKVARLLGARREEIVFTSPGAEANNLAIKNYQEKSGLTSQAKTY